MNEEKIDGNDESVHVMNELIIHVCNMSVTRL